MAFSHLFAYAYLTTQTELSANEIWKQYMQLNRVESALQDLKSELGLRPVYHQTSSRTEAHLFIGVLAYHLIINPPVEDSGFYSRMEQLLEKINAHTSKSFSFSFSASISEISSQYSDISKMYNKAVINLMYRYVLDLGVLITPNKVAHNNCNLGLNINLKSEVRFLEAIRKYDIQRSENRLSTRWSCLYVFKVVF